MKFPLNGAEKCIVWKSPSLPHSDRPWRVAWGRNGCPFDPPTWFATWREAMDVADFKQAHKWTEEGWGR